MSLTLLIGPARSGKSALALQMALAWSGDVTFIATAEARDEEMTTRIERHRTQRPPGWRTVEEPTLIGNKIADVPGESFVIVDCLTLWVSNLLEHSLDPPQIEEVAHEAAKMAAAHSSPVVIVTNEVGAGIVPLDASVRVYQDLLGSVNGIFAEQADDVLLIAAGRVLKLARPEEVVPHLLDR